MSQNTIPPDKYAKMSNISLTVFVLMMGVKYSQNRPHINRIISSFHNLSILYFWTIEFEDIISQYAEKETAPMISL